MDRNAPRTRPVVIHTLIDTHGAPRGGDVKRLDDEAGLYSSAAAERLGFRAGLQGRYPGRAAVRGVPVLLGLSCTRPPTTSPALSSKPGTTRTSGTRSRRCRTTAPNRPSSLPAATAAFSTTSTA